MEKKGNKSSLRYKKRQKPPDLLSGGFFAIFADYLTRMQYVSQQ